MRPMKSKELQQALEVARQEVKPLGESLRRVHRRKVELEKARKYDGRQTAYDEINQIDFKEAWRRAVEVDAGIPDDPPENLPEEAKRAVITLARSLAVLEREWC